jgi:DNA mismatch repair protein MutS2
MAISEQSLETLEFPKILERLAQHTAFSASRALALALRPSTVRREVAERQQRTEEARRLLDAQPDLSVGGARDIRPAVGLARRGGVLEPASFLELLATLVSMRRLGESLRRLEGRGYPLLLELGERLPRLPALEEAIGRTVGEDGEVLDSASPQLARIRGEVRVAFDRLQEKLQNLLGSSGYAGALQEPIVTVRNGRYVVPVKASHRREVRGLVHDQSASGATLYIEPMAIVELNNRYRELQSAEANEVARVLGELSELVGAEAGALAGGVEALAEIDLLFAKARYSQLLRCTAPEIVEQNGQDAPVRLVRARHPLLDPARVVPVDLWLGGEFRILLITGPNTGGKTVALKTLGLLALMAQAGLQIPAQAPSRLPVFGQIFADIGDEQSIEQSLSTFSSHMTNIIRVLGALERPRDLDGDEAGLALVLFDELGAGTDPVEGAALARVIIERLLELGVLGAATTHYAELKAFAYATEGVQNASVEFDVETLAPTYRLSIGLPGRSNALAIATRLGLDRALVERARGSITGENVQVEDLLGEIHREREQAEAERRRADELRADAEKLQRRLAEEYGELQRTKEAQLEAAREELEQQVREARQQLRRLRDEFRSVSLTRQWLEEAEQRVQQAAEAIPALAPPQAVPELAGEAPLAVGETVFVRSVGLSGELLEIDAQEQEADVQVGGFRMRVGLGELERRQLNSKEARSERRREERRISLPALPEVSMSFDMRGWRAGEVAEKLDRYLNDAYLAGLPQVRLIHGKGTGALRQVVREVLSGHPLVSSYAGGGQDGGDGVTVATMVQR